MTTSPSISFGLFALEIKPDSTPSMSGLQSFSSANDIKTDNVSPLPYATYEPNFWKLDGNCKLLPVDTSSVHVGLMSTAMSDGSGNFSVAPVLTITFSAPHSTDGMVLRFSQATGDWANSVTVAWYDASNAMIVTHDYSPTSWEFDFDLSVVNFQKIIITFHSTNKPYRYLRLTGVDYGQLLSFTGSDIRAASIIEQIDMLSTTIPINTADIQLYTTDAEFSIVNPSGAYARLSQRQPLSIYETVNGGQLFLGQYYLDTWLNINDNEIEFSCIDLVGILDRTPYQGGIWTGSGILLQTLISQMLGAISIPYDLDLNLYGIYVIGWIPQCTYRQALQHIAFAVGAYVDCSRSNQLKIYQAVIAADATPGTGAPITNSMKGMDQSVKLKTLVTGVEITAHNYLSVSTSVSLFNGSLDVGSYEIDFAQPVHDLSITGATITSSGVNYAVINVTSPGTVVLSGQSYIDTTQLFSQYNLGLNQYTTPNILKVTDATLVNNINGQSVVSRVYDYNQQRYLQTAKLYAPLLQPAQLVLVDTVLSSKIRGVIEQMNIDLEGGFRVDTSIVGVID